MTETPAERIQQYNNTLAVVGLRHTAVSLATTVVVLAGQIGAYHITDRWWSQAANISVTVVGIAAITALFLRFLRQRAALKRQYLGDATKT